MTITLKLSRQEIEGIRLYLESVSGEVNPVIYFDDIGDYLSMCATSELHSPRCAVADWVTKAERESIVTRISWK